MKKRRHEKISNETLTPQQKTEEVIRQKEKEVAKSALTPEEKKRLLYFQNKTTVRVYDEDSFRGSRGRAFEFSSNDPDILTDAEKEEWSELLEKQRMHQLIAQDSTLAIKRRKREEAVERYPFISNDLAIQECVARGDPRSVLHPRHWIKAMVESDSIPQDIVDEAKEWLAADYEGFYLSEIYEIVNYLLEKAGFETI